MQVVAAGDATVIRALGIGRIDGARLVSAERAALWAANRGGTARALASRPSMWDEGFFDSRG